MAYDDNLTIIDEKTSQIIVKSNGTTQNLKLLNLPNFKWFWTISWALKLDNMILFCTYFIILSTKSIIIKYYGLKCLKITDLYSNCIIIKKKL